MAFALGLRPGTKEEGSFDCHSFSESDDIWFGDFGPISVAQHMTPGLLSQPGGSMEG